MRSITKDAWQILSEELGDGDVERNHVFVYRDLLRSVNVDLPAADSQEFVASDLGMDNVSVWRGAVAQLLMGLFSHDFLPEALGFNLFFEQVTLETLQAAHELPKLGISGYYFLLHVCIDNTDSGHSAMAQSLVSHYLDTIRESGSEKEVELAWRRIQAGYVLSRQMGDEESGDGNAAVPSLRSLSAKEDRVMRMLQCKARASSALHCKSRVKIAGQPLAAWLSSHALDNPQNQVSLLDGLRQASPWVRSGDSSSSLLVRELSWGGKMFGAFTDTEVEHLKEWIDSLPHKSEEYATDTYWNMIGSPDQSMENSKISPVAQDQGLQFAIAFARKVICWSTESVANEATLLGLARAFFDLEIWVANDQDLLNEEGRHAEFAMGYEIGREEIEKAIGSM
ncbi:hypothetical protein ONZ43_g696 [Nemania bipapillata]|uniref:Uncharacterized protein n=1 Tax=Nemania bipapillata TaxID=110536 RepID=A0ACC2J7F0_9PEZI|nr:hypothetical protein ONZ43_g696 [Nemania bipapillata]